MNILFQLLEIDYVIGDTNKELLPMCSGPAAILRIFGVTKEGFQQTLEGRMRESNRSSNVPRFVKRVEMVQKKSFMYYQQHKAQPFLKIVVALATMVASCRVILERGIQIEGLGSKNFLTYESNVLFTLRFMIDCNVVGGNWIEVSAGKYKKKVASFSYCQLEFDCLYSELISHVPEGEYSKMAPFRILSFDIECVGCKGLFPEPTHNPVIQIANLVTLQAEDQPFIRNVMTLKSCSSIVGVDVMSFAEEKYILLTWRDYIREIDPDILIGYNICKFDLPYLIDRAEALKIMGFLIFGRVRNSRVRVRDTTFSSRQYGIRESKDITIEGRVQFDLLQLKEFPVEACKLQLSVLDLSNNSLSSLPPELGTMTSLRKLLLNGNPIRTIRSSLVSGPTPALLKHLRSRLSSTEEASGSSSGSMKIDVIAETARLSLSSKELPLSGLGLTSVPSTVWEMAEVVKVDLSRNSIAELPNELATCSSLQVLILSGNKITQWPGVILSSLPNLSSLKLDNNPLSKIPPGSLEALSKLETLDLSGNASSLLDSAAFSLLPQLKELHLRRMKLSHIPTVILSLKQLRVLDLSQNLLVSLPEDIWNLTSLQELDLSDNNIATLPPELGLLESHLQVLKLDGNPLRSIRRPVLDRGTKAILKYLKDKLPEQ